VHELRHVVVVELEVLLAEQVLDVGQVAGHEVVHGNDMVPFGQEPVAEVRAEEAGAARNQNAFFICHMGVAAAP
jgi:hypothetical protein